MCNVIYYAVRDGLLMEMFVYQSFWVCLFPIISLTWLQQEPITFWKYCLEKMQLWTDYTSAGSHVHAVFTYVLIFL